jgi:predicted nucleotidyltransferase/HEPN domain-containing protein
MKKSVSYLPENKQEDLRRITRFILERLPQCEMIILYGSYARNKYVDFDERVEFGISTSFRSDYDILVVTSGIPDKEAGRILDQVDDKYYRNPDKQTPIEFINEDIGKLNRDLSEGRYFYTQIRQEGIILYDSGKFELAHCRKLNYEEIKQQAQEYFDDKYGWGNDFLEGALFYYNRKNYKMASFMLHQACENYFYAIRLSYTLRNSKQHNLDKLLSSVKKYSNDLAKVFPRDTQEEKRLFELIRTAYVEARYNPDFSITVSDIDALIPKVECLGNVTKRICEKEIEQYEKLGKEKYP